MEGLTPSRKGAIAEAAIVARAIRLGIDVYLPVADGGRCDLILGMGHELLRVQCKCAVLIGDVLSVRLLSTFRAPGGGYVRRTYGADEIDAFAAYSIELDRCFLIPIGPFLGRKQIHLRLAPAKNCQRRGIHLAEQYELGAIAQLGERQSGTLEAAGSSPASST